MAGSPTRSAQQPLTNTASIRGGARDVLPSIVRSVGSTATDFAVALRHKPSDADAGDARRIVRLILLGYAHHADKDVHGAYPSPKTTADNAECDIRTCGMATVAEQFWRICSAGSQGASISTWSAARRSRPSASESRREHRRLQSDVMC